VGTRAPILGIAGLIFIFFGLFSHWASYNPAAGLFAMGWYDLSHLVVGVGCLIVYFSRGSGSLTHFVRQRSTRYGANALIYSILFVTVVVMANFIGARYHKRWDISAAGVNSISEQSRRVLEQLKDEVTIDAFLDGGRDPLLEELIDAYRYHSDAIRVSFIDPQVHPEKAQEARIVQIPTLVISMGENSTLVTKTDEESITNGIHRVSGAEQKKIYFVDGHGEPPIDDQQSASGFGLFADALRNQNYVVDKLFLPDVADVPEDAAVVIAPATNRPYFPHELEALGRYMVGGGRVMFLLDPKQGEEVVRFLSAWGVEVGDDVIVDQQVRLFQGATLGLDPVVSDYGQHPSTAPMKERTIFSLVRSVGPAEEPAHGLVAASIAKTSRTSWAETDLKRLFQQSEAELNDVDKTGPVSIGVAVSAYVKDLENGDKDSDKEFEMIVFGDSAFVNNKYWRQLFNDALALATVGWLAGQEELISIGPRAVRASRASLTPTQARSVFYLSVMVLPELILLCGIVVWWRRTSL